MRHSILLAIALAALAVIAAGIPSANSVAVAQVPQIKPKPNITLPWLAGVTLDKTTAVGGSVDGNIAGYVQLLRPAVSDLTVTLSCEGCLMDEAGILVATLPSSVTIPAGNDGIQFRITTYSSLNTLAAVVCTVKARYGNEQRSAVFTVEPLKITSFTVVPSGGIGPFTATGTIGLNARPAANVNVTLTSNNPIVRFGTAGSSQSTTSVTFTSTNAMRTFQVVAGSVAQPTTATITATRGVQSLERQVAVRP